MDLVGIRGGPFAGAGNRIITCPFARPSLSTWKSNFPEARRRISLATVEPKLGGASTHQAAGLPARRLCGNFQTTCCGTLRSLRGDSVIHFDY